MNRFQLLRLRRGAGPIHTPPGVLPAFPQEWSRSLIVGLALFAWLALPGMVRAAPRASVGTTLEQCQNGKSGIGDCTGSAWVTGNLNPNNSLYREGDFVPFRSVITSLVAELVPHGLNDTEAGRRINRRVFVTIVHLRVFKS